MGAEYLSYLKSIATFAPTFYVYIISVLANVIHYILYNICVNAFKIKFLDVLDMKNRIYNQKAYMNKFFHNFYRIFYFLPFQKENKETKLLKIP